MRIIITLLFACVCSVYAHADTACQNFVEHEKWRKENDFFQKMYFNVKKEIEGEFVYRIDLLVQNGKQLYVTGPLPPKHYFNKWALVLVMENLYCPYAEGTGGWGMTAPNQFFASDPINDLAGWSIDILNEEQYLIKHEPMIKEEYQNVLQGAMDELKIGIRGYFPNAKFVPDDPNNLSPYAQGEWNLGQYDYFGKTKFTQKAFERAIRTYYFLTSPHDSPTFKELNELVSNGKIPERYFFMYMPTSTDSSEGAEYKIKSLDYFFRIAYKYSKN